MPKRINQTSVAMFTDDPAGTLRYSVDFEPAWDETYLRNHIAVNAPDGTRGRTGSGVAVDDASTTDYGVIVDTIDSLLASGGDRQALAEYNAYLYAQPRLRVPELPLIGAVNPASAWPVILSLDIGAAITVKRFDGLTAPMTLELNVEGGHYGSQAGQPIQVAIRTSPRDTRTYMVADDATLGVADSTNLAAP